MRTRIVLLSIALSFLPLIAEAAGTPRTFKELAGLIVRILESGVGVLLTAAIVIYVYGIARNMMNLSEGEASAYRDFILWGIGIIFVMVSIWGILRILQNSLFGTDSSTTLNSVELVSSYVA